MMIKLGYILDAPERPTRFEQAMSLKSLGVPMKHIWSDKFRGRAPAQPQTALTHRNGMLRLVRKGDEVYFPAPECMGVSPGDVRWMAEQLAAKGVSIIVVGSLLAVEPGAPLDDLLRAVKRWQGRKDVAAYRARQKDR